MCITQSSQQSQFQPYKPLAMAQPPQFMVILSAINDLRTQINAIQQGANTPGSPLNNHPEFGTCLTVGRLITFILYN